MRINTLSVVALTLLHAGCATRQAFENRSSYASHDVTSVQALIGASLYDGLKFESSDPADPDHRAVADLSQMPLLGIAGQYRLAGDRENEAGLDGALIFDWWQDSAQVVATGGGSQLISVSARLLMTDISFGGYAATVVGNWLRLYAGAGPLLLFASGRFGDEDGSSSESGFGVGGYVRAGAELRLDDQSFLGFGARAMTSNIDFGGSVQDVDADALQLMLTFTQQF